MTQCTRCQQDLPLNAENFGRRRTAITGFTGVCRPCTRTVRNLRNSKQREKINKSQQKRRSNIPAEKLEEARVRARDWYTVNAETAKAAAKARNARVRCEMIEAYGSECECCQENEPRFLTIDHTEGQGTKHRKEVGGAGNAVMHDLKRRGWPKEGYRLLCYNCNCGRARNNGICPHQDHRNQEETHGSRQRASQGQVPSFFDTDL